MMTYYDTSTRLYRQHFEAIKRNDTVCALEIKINDIMISFILFILNNIYKSGRTLLLRQWNLMVFKTPIEEEKEEEEKEEEEEEEDYIILNCS